MKLGMNKHKKERERVCRFQNTTHLYTTVVLQPNEEEEEENNTKVHYVQCAFVLDGSTFSAAKSLAFKAIFTAKFAEQTNFQSKICQTDSVCRQIDMSIDRSVNRSE